MSVVVPSYNEGAAITQTISLITNCEELGRAQVIVVDDGSTDGSLDDLRGTQGLDSNLVVVRANKRRGKGWAMREGVRQADAPVIAIIDADAPIPMSEVARCVRMFVIGNIDCLLGVRIDAGDERPRASALRRAGTKSLRRAVHLRGEAFDPFCPLKIVRAGSRAADTLLATKLLGYLSDVEFRYQLNRAGIFPSDERVLWHDQRGPASRIMLRYSPSRVLRDWINLRPVLRSYREMQGPSR